MAKISKLDRELIKSLKESTGVSFLDSGGSYGRHWQRNQLRDFLSEKSYSLTVNSWGIEYTKNIFHFLRDCLEWHPQLNRSFNEFQKKYDNNYSWFEVLREFLTAKIKTGYIQKTGIYSDGGYVKKYDDIFCEYTYNQENVLSQDFQYWLFSTKNDDEIAVIMIHNGCDARGGFTSPKFYTYEDSLLMYSDCYIGCENGHSWYSDDSGYHWYESNNEGIDLKECELIDQSELIENEEYQDKLSRQEIINPDQLTLLEDYHPKVINPVYPLILGGKPIIIYNDDKIGLCPLCGSPLS